jgi:hypothetical protein
MVGVQGATHFCRVYKYPENSAKFARGEAFSGISGALSSMKDRLILVGQVTPGPLPPPQGESDLVLPPLWG